MLFPCLKKVKITISISEWQYVISLPENDKYIVARKQFPKKKFSKDSIYIDKKKSPKYKHKAVQKPKQKSPYGVRRRRKERVCRQRQLVSSLFY